MPQYVVERSAKILNKYKKALNGSKILILGVAYKQDIDDYRESPALKVIENFEKEGSIVDYYDPFIPEYKYKEVKKESLEKIDEDILNEYDLVVVTTMHTSFDYNMIQKYSKVVFDTKNAMSKVKERNNIVIL